MNYEIERGYRSDKDIIDSYIKGTLHGVYVRDNDFFIKIRVTGLGVTKRLDETESSLNLIRTLRNFKVLDATKLEHLSFQELLAVTKELKLQPINFMVYKEVNRKEQDFASPETLELYNGLPILLDHPEGNTLLNFENLAYNTIVGSVIKAFKLNDAVFAVARIYDLSVLDELEKFKSTSPAVVTVEVKENGHYKELPFTFNHLAFVQNGHWDQISDYAIDNSKITIEKGEEMPIEVVEKTDSITDPVSTPEIKEAKVDEFESKLDTANDEVVDGEEVIEVKPGEAVEISDEDIEIEHPAIEVKTDSEKIDELQAKVDELTAQLASKQDCGDVKVESDDNIIEVHSDSDDEVKIDNEPSLVNEIKDENATDITKTVECDEDTERKELIDAMRKVVDSVDLKDVQMPYIEGRKKPSFVIKTLLRSNRQYVDEKFQGIIDRDNSYRNYALCVDAFNNMIKNIKEADKANKEYYAKEVKSQKGWVVDSSNPNIMVDKSF